MTDAAKISKERISAVDAFEAAMAKLPKTMGYLARVDKSSAQNSKGTAMSDELIDKLARAIEQGLAYDVETDVYAAETCIEERRCIATRMMPVIRSYGDKRDADAYERGKLEGARLAIEVAERAANKSITHHCTEIGLGTYFRRGDQLQETSQWWKLQRVEALVREMRDLPGQSIRALSPAKIVGEG